jgi:hypothetical protein
MVIEFNVSSNGLVILAQLLAPYLDRNLEKLLCDEKVSQEAKQGFKEVAALTVKIIDSYPIAKGIEARKKEAETLANSLIGG